MPRARAPLEVDDNNRTDGFSGTVQRVMVSLGMVTPVDERLSLTYRTWFHQLRKMDIHRAAIAALFPANSAANRRVYER